MLFTQQEKESILSGFPNIKLSYENMIYKKVSTCDYVVAIPKGAKCFAWFTLYQNKPTCFIMELTSKKQIVDIKMFHACFSSDLAYGTIFYGTLFYTSSNRFFTIEDIFLYKGNIIERSTWDYKWTLIQHILQKDLKQISYNPSFVVFGRPLFSKTIEALDKKIKNVQYPIHAVQMYLLSQVNQYITIEYSDYCLDEEPSKKDNDKKPLDNNPVIHNNNTTHSTFTNHSTLTNHRKETFKKEHVFLIKPDIQEDIYHLFTIDPQGKEITIGNAHIPDYETSVMMNKIFRIIKENDNLDALEESDDEEEFENEQLDKFVKLDSSKKMVCKYHYKFKRWFPLRIAPATAAVLSFDEYNSLDEYKNNKYVTRRNTLSHGLTN
jgi:hypothetical protein